MWDGHRQEPWAPDIEILDCLKRKRDICIKTMCPHGPRLKDIACQEARQLKSRLIFGSMLANVCFLNGSNVKANGNRVRWSLVVYPDSQIKVNLNKDGRKIRVCIMTYNMCS